VANSDDDDNHDFQWCGGVRVVETSKHLEPAIEESQELPIPMVINGGRPDRLVATTRNVILPLMLEERRKLEAIHVFVLDVSLFEDIL
jgi:hypothetical protein